MSGMAIRYINLPSTAVTTAVDIAELVCESGDDGFYLDEVRVTQSSDAGDSESEQIVYTIKRGVGETSGSGGSAATMGDTNTGTGGTQTAGELFNTTQATAGSGSLTTLLTEAENVHNGWHHAPPSGSGPHDDRRFKFLPGQTCVISMSAPADSLTVQGYIVIQELYEG